MNASLSYHTHPICRPIKDVVLPLSSPIRGRDGTLMSEIPIPKGTEIIMGVLGHNTNTALWGADANEWKPERWLAPLPDALTEAPAPGVYANLWVHHTVRWEVRMCS